MGDLQCNKRSKYAIISLDCMNEAYIAEHHSCNALLTLYKLDHLSHTDIN